MMAPSFATAKAIKHISPKDEKEKQLITKQAPTCSSRLFLQNQQEEHTSKSSNNKMKSQGTSNLNLKLSQQKCGTNNMTHHQSLQAKIKSQSTSKTKSKLLLQEKDEERIGRLKAKNTENTTKLNTKKNGKVLLNLAKEMKKTKPNLFSIEADQHKFSTHSLVTPQKSLSLNQSKIKHTKIKDQGCIANKQTKGRRLIISNNQKEKNRDSMQFQFQDSALAQAKQVASGAIEKDMEKRNCKAHNQDKKKHGVRGRDKPCFTSNKAQEKRPQNHLLLSKADYEKPTTSDRDQHCVLKESKPMPGNGIIDATKNPKVSKLSLSKRKTKSKVRKASKEAQAEKQIANAKTSIQMKTTTKGKSLAKAQQKNRNKKNQKKQDILDQTSLKESKGKMLTPKPKLQNSTEKKAHSSTVQMKSKIPTETAPRYKELSIVSEKTKNDTNHSASECHTTIKGKANPKKRKESPKEKTTDQNAVFLHTNKKKKVEKGSKIQSTSKKDRQATDYELLFGLSDDEDDGKLKKAVALDQLGSSDDDDDDDDDWNNLFMQDLS